MGNGKPIINQSWETNQVLKPYFRVLAEDSCGLATAIFAMCVLSTEGCLLVVSWPMRGMFGVAHTTTPCWLGVLLTVCFSQVLTFWSSNATRCEMSGKKTSSSLSSQTGLLGSRSVGGHPEMNGWVLRCISENTEFWKGRVLRRRLAEDIDRIAGRVWPAQPQVKLLPDEPYLYIPNIPPLLWGNLRLDPWNLFIRTNGLAGPEESLWSKGWKICSI